MKETGKQQGGGLRSQGAGDPPQVLRWAAEEPQPGQLLCMCDVCVMCVGDVCVWCLPTPRGTGEKYRSGN